MEIPQLRGILIPLQKSGHDNLETALQFTPKRGQTPLPLPLLSFLYKLYQRLPSFGGGITQELNIL